MTKSRSCIALVAHDNKKAELVEWVKQHRDILSNYELCATGCGKRTGPVGGQV